MKASEFVKICANSCMHKLHGLKVDMKAKLVVAEHFKHIVTEFERVEKEQNTKNQGGN